MFLTPFQFANTPEIIFGTGVLSKLSSYTKRYGDRALLVIGKNSFKNSAHYATITNQISLIGEVIISGEPSPVDIDQAVERYRSTLPDVIVGIGGGSVLDAAKAISAMLTVEHPVKEYLEGVGTRNHPGTKIPMIAIPTTAGTGSEATKNAVLTEVGEQGYKKSLRHIRFVPDVALVDPELMLGCPAFITASSGMDAFTQLLESYVSTQANTMTDALAERGLFSIHVGLQQAVQYDSLAARSHMAHAALLSGITLANAGLGTVHGFASSIGGYFSIPHGVVCSRLMHSCNEITIRNLKKNKNNPYWKKYVYVGKLFSQKDKNSEQYFVDFLLNKIKDYTEEFSIPKLSEYGIQHSDFDKIIRATENKNNPYNLSLDELKEALELSW